MPAYIVEKYSWVCWLLGRIFSTDSLSRDCVFKGGTSRAKVFNAIHRFSKDIDLGRSPPSLGWKETDLDDAPSKTATLKRVAQIEADCAQAVPENFVPTLEKVAPKQAPNQAQGCTDAALEASNFARIRTTRAATSAEIAAMSCRVGFPWSTARSPPT